MVVVDDLRIGRGGVILQAVTMGDDGRMETGFGEGCPFVHDRPLPSLDITQKCGRRFGGSEFFSLQLEASSL